VVAHPAGIGVVVAVGGTTAQLRSVRTRSPTKLLGNSSRDSATATFYLRPPTEPPN
jgi:hypothetical protein